MAKRKTNIIGLVFRCEDCGQNFRIGTAGVDACLKRVSKHMHDKGHFNIPPVNPPKGLTYKSESGTVEVEVVFDGKDAEAFIKKVKDLVVKYRCNFIPQMKLSKVK
jgi:hypothetical protein